MKAAYTSEVVVFTDEPAWHTIENHNLSTHDNRNPRVGSVWQYLLPCGSESSAFPFTMKIKIHRTIILSAVLNGCETWPCVLKEECKWWVFENEMARRIFGSQGRSNKKLGKIV
jgi:hypothetical protein